MLFRSLALLVSASSECSQKEGTAGTASAEGPGHDKGPVKKINQKENQEAPDALGRRPQAHGLSLFVPACRMLYLYLSYTVGRT